MQNRIAVNGEGASVLEVELSGEFGKRYNFIRKVRSLSFAQVAKAVGVRKGVAQGWSYAVETPNMKPRAVHLLPQVLGVPKEVLFPEDFPLEEIPDQSSSADQIASSERHSA